MQKDKLNITMDKDLIEYIKIYAGQQRTSVSEVFTQFTLNLKRLRDADPMDVILADAEFTEGLLKTAAQIRTGKMKWHKYEEVF